jgi:hypothetical protein
MKDKPAKSCIPGHADAGWKYLSTPAPEHNRETEPEDVAVHTLPLFPFLVDCCVFVFPLLHIFGLISDSKFMNCEHECISKANMYFLPTSTHLYTVQRTYIVKQISNQKKMRRREWMKIIYL